MSKRRPRTLDKMPAVERLALLKQAIDAKFAEIATKRDELRGLVDDVEAVIDSIDEAGLEIADGLRALQDAVDRLSERL